MRFLFIIILLFNSLAYADCDFKTIKKTKDGYLYSKDCHVKVGELVRDNKNLRIVGDLKDKKIELKDLQIVRHEERVLLWQSSTYEIEDRYNKRKTMAKWEKYMYLALGVVITGLAVKGAQQLR